MYRSWAYILIIAATLAGMIALVWPAPQVRTIEEIEMPSHPAPRAEAPVKAPKAPTKGGAKAAKPAPPPPAAPAPPAVIRNMPASNTTTHRTTPMIENGMQPNPLSGLGQVAPGAPPPAAKLIPPPRPMPTPHTPPHPTTPGHPTMPLRPPALHPGTQ